MTKQTGRLTLPTDADIVEETIRNGDAGCVIE